MSEPEVEVVAEIDAAATRAEQRGRYEAASAAWERTAELSTEHAARATRVFSAARGSWTAGRPARAGQHADTVLREAGDPLLRADSARLRARVEWTTGSVKLAHRMLLEANRDVATHDLDRSRGLAAAAVAISV